MCEIEKYIYIERESDKIVESVMKRERGKYSFVQVEATQGIHNPAGRTFSHTFSTKNPPLFLKS